MSKEESKDHFQSVYSYLKAVTIAGGIAAASLPLAVQSMIELSIKDISATQTSETRIQEPVLLPEVVIEGDFMRDVPEVLQTASALVASKETDIYPVKPTDAGSDNLSLMSEPMPPSEPEVLSHDMMLVDALPSASVDVFPVGYGSFRIIIQSQASGIFTASLFDTFSNEIISESYEVFQGDNTFVLESGSIPQGEYLLRVTDGTVISEKKVRLK